MKQDHDDDDSGIPTFAEAKALRTNLLKRWQKGSEQERKLARVLGRCRKGKRCGSAECPVCERRLAAERNVGSSPTACLRKCGNRCPA
jgi:hypothetical protein